MYEIRRVQVKFKTRVERLQRTCIS